MAKDLPLFYLKQLRTSYQWNLDNLPLSPERKIRDEAKLELLDMLIAEARDGI